MKKSLWMALAIVLAPLALVGALVLYGSQKAPVEDSYDGVIIIEEPQE